MPKKPQREFCLFLWFGQIPALGPCVAIFGRRFQRRVTVSQSPICETDGRSIVFSDSGRIFQLKRIVVVAENDWNDMREQRAGHNSCKEKLSVASANCSLHYSHLGSAGLSTTMYSCSSPVPFPMIAFVPAALPLPAFSPLRTPSNLVRKPRLR